MRQLDFTAHQLGQSLILFDGDSVRSETSSTAYHRLRPNVPELNEVVVASRYSDGQRAVSAIL